MRRIKEYDEDISQLPLCVNISHLYISLLYMVSQEVMSHFYVFRSHEKLGFGLSTGHCSYHT
jgi:hypothetical protein